jgi:hypothetical protein
MRALLLLDRETFPAFPSLLPRYPLNWRKEKEMTRSLRTISLLVLTLALAVPMMALNVVNTSAPSINCVFSTTCSIVVNDMGSNLPNGGRIQSRIFQGQPGSPMAGKWVYEYRVNMANAVGFTYVPYVDGMYIVGWGPVLAYDYNFDSIYTDQVFVVTAGGIGTVGLSSVNVFWGATFFNLSSPVYGGSFPGDGESSYFFGLVSNYAPTVKTAQVHMDNGYAAVNVYAPNVP